MRIGISVCSNYRVQDPREGARWMVERAAAAEESSWTQSPELQPCFGRRSQKPQTSERSVTHLLDAEHGESPAERIPTSRFIGDVCGGVQPCWLRQIEFYVKDRCRSESVEV